MVTLLLRAVKASAEAVANMDDIFSQFGDIFGGAFGGGFGGFGGGGQRRAKEVICVFA